MTDEYSNRELDEKFDHITEKLDLILDQTTKHNGRLSKVERNMLIIGCIMGTVGVIYFPQIINIVKLLL